MTREALIALDVTQYTDDAVAEMSSSEAVERYQFLAQLESDVIAGVAVTEEPMPEEVRADVERMVAHRQRIAALRPEVLQ